MATIKISELTEITTKPQGTDIVPVVDTSESTTKKITVDTLATYVDSAHVQLRQDFAYSSLTGSPTALSSFTNDTLYLDSSTVTGVIDATYVQANQTPQDFAYSSLTGSPTALSSFTNDTLYLDSSTVVGVINATYVQANQTPQDFAYASLTGAPTALSSFTNDTNYLDSNTVGGVINAAYVQANQITYNTSDFADSAYVSSRIDALIGSAPGTLDTLNEIALALGNDDSAYGTLISLISAKADAPQVGELIDSAISAGLNTAGNLNVDALTTLDSTTIDGDLTVNGVIDGLLYINESNDVSAYHNIPFLDQDIVGGNAGRLFAVDQGGLRFNPGANQFQVTRIIGTDQTHTPVSSALGQIGLVRGSDGKKQLQVSESGIEIYGTLNVDSDGAGNTQNLNVEGITTLDSTTIDGNLLVENTVFGDLVEFRNDGTPVGSIGSATGPVMYIVLNYAETNNVAALKGASGAILPSTNVGADKDNTMSLGSSSARFFDLYLSNKVIVGGGGASENGEIAFVADTTRARIVGGYDAGGGGGGYLAFHTDTAGGTDLERARFNNAGNLAFTGGNGIDFSANTNAAGMTSQLLNDYEEGTWTPSVAFGSISGTSITYTGKYVKVGDMVTYTFKANNAAGDIQVSSYVTFEGLPFALSNNATSTVVTEDADVFSRQGFAVAGGVGLTLSACGSSSGTNDLFVSLTGKLSS